MHAHDHKHEDGAHRPARPPQAAAATGRGAGEVLGLQRLIGNAATADLVGSVLDESRAEQAEVQRSSMREVLSGPGKPVPDDLRAEAEAGLGVDLSGVRLHTGAAAERSAAEFDAHAYTTGRDVVLGRGGHDKKTLLHEFDHVRQQSEGEVEGTATGGGVRMSHPSDRHEKEAEANATRALRGEARHDRGGPLAGAAAGGVPVQFAKIGEVQPGLSTADVNRIMTRLLSMPLIVPVPLPSGTGASTRRQLQNVNRAVDPRLDDQGGGLGFATITWDDLLRGDVVRMAYGSYDVFVTPHSGDSLAAATDDLMQMINAGNFTGDPVLQSFGTAMMGWLVRRRSNTSGNVEVATNRITSDEGTGAEVAIGGRPGWDNRANQIVTGYDEDRRHIIAWHTMRGAFRNAFNAALAPGENIRGRMRALIETLDSAATWAELDALETSSANNSQDVDAAADETASQGSGGDVSMTDAAPVATPSPPASRMDVDTPPRVGSPSSEHGSSQASTTSEQLRGNLSAVVARVLSMLSNNPYNLWAGDSTANQSINRVRQQLVPLLSEHNDDQVLIDQVRTRARQAAGTQNQDRAVWTEVRDTLEGVAAGDARTFVQSIVDSFDVDVPVTGGDETSSTYDTVRDQAAAIRNVLSTGLAQEVLVMYDNQLPTDFDELIILIDGWLRQFLRPQDLQTAVSGGRRTVGRRQDG